MEALDGNAIGGPLLELYGRDMTAASGTCGHCGSVSRIAELRIYAAGPGTVGRCRSCGEVVLVLTSIREQLRVTFRQFEITLFGALGRCGGGPSPWCGLRR